MKHKSIKRMMNKRFRILPEDVARFAVFNSDRMTDDKREGILTALINKCIDDTIKHEMKGGVDEKAKAKIQRAMNHFQANPQRYHEGMDTLTTLIQ